MTVIEIPDDQAAALTAKAAAAGLSLKAWLKQLADNEGPPVSPPSRKPLSEVIGEIWADMPADVRAKLPRDGASQVDHYVYGLPKRDV
jgi:hypothetical protein